MRRVKLFATAILLVIAAACDDEVFPYIPCPDGNPDATLSAHVQPIFDSKCNSCHGGNVSPNLSKGWAYDELIDREGAINVNEPCQSGLYLVATGNHSSHPGLTSEPDSAEIANIIGWIKSGGEGELPPNN